MKGNTLCLFLLVLLIFSACGSSDKNRQNDNNTGRDIVITRNKIGTYDGYDYELWKNEGTFGRMVLGNSGTFSCRWNGTENALFRTGKKFGSTQTHSQIGNISLNYSASFLPSNTGVSYLCVYGWTVNPLIEFYVVDSWGHSNRPPGSWAGATHKGVITIDEGVYDIYVSTRTNMPSIQGTRTFQQYWSVRQSKRTSGTISVSEHLKKWEELGMPLGNMYEVALCVEGYNSNGSAEVTENTLIIKN
ncbi:MAG: glycoside hydrolase family 11 protein [Treponema sp.]|nr:glycoside hydrolase family 11 protein [Treponema sp.]